MFLSEWRKFPSAPCLAEENNLMTARVSMLLKSRASLTCFRACSLPGRAKDLSAPQYMCIYIYMYIFLELRPTAGHGVPIHEVSRSHTTTHHTQQDTSGRVISLSQRPLTDNTQHPQQTDIHAPGGI